MQTSPGELESVPLEYTEFKTSANVRRSN